MKLFLFLILFSTSAFAIDCDCEVVVYAPMTASHKLPPKILEKWELYEFTTYSDKNQNKCQLLCLEKYQDEMTTKRLKALLSLYGQALIEEKSLGYNCTGLTTMKFPVRVKASLGKLGLGNVVNIVQVLNHEEICF